MSSSRASGAWAALLLAALALAGWRVLGLGMADHYAELDPARALAWRPDHPEALLRAAQQLASDPAQADEATALARRAIAAHPLDGRGYRVLGVLADQRGDETQAALLLGIAAQRSPRDLLSQAWLLDYHLAAGRVGPALQHLDFLLRFDPSLTAGFEPLMLALALEPQAQPVLAERLARRPPWRTHLLTMLSQKAPDSTAVAPLFDYLRRQPGGLSQAELSAWLERLGRDGEWGQAYLVWTSQLPPEQLQRLGNVYNGGFEWEPGQGGFDWRIARVPGARVDRLAGEGVTGTRALRVSFDDRRVPFNHVRQLLALPPGAYLLKGRARPDNLRTDRGLVWAVTCTDGRELGESEPLRGSGPWRAWSVPFEVPAQDCGGQWLSLRLRARIPAEQRIGGRAWFDDIKIVRLGPAAAVDPAVTP